MKNEKMILEDILVVEVLSLAKTIKAEEKSKGIIGFRDYTDDAIEEIRKRRPDILQKLLFPAISPK